VNRKTKDSSLAHISSSQCLAGVLGTSSFLYVFGHPLVESSLMILFTNATLPLYSNNTARHKVMQQAAEHIMLSKFILILLALYYLRILSDLFFIQPSILCV